MQESYSNDHDAEGTPVAPYQEFTVFQLYYERLASQMPAQDPADVLKIQLHGSLFTETSRLLASLAQPILKKEIWQVEDRIIFAKFMAGKQLLDKDREINLLALQKLLHERYGLSEFQYQEVVLFWRKYIEANKK